MNAPLDPAREHPARCAATGPQRRGFCRPRRGLSGLCHGASGWAGAVAAGPAKRAAGRSAPADRIAAPGAADAPRPSARRADRGGRRTGLPGAFGGGGGNSWQSHGAQLYRQPAAGAAGGQPWRHSLADPSCRAARTQRAARPLAGDDAAFGAEPGRCGRTRRGPVAGRIAAVARQAPRRLGGQP